MKKIISIILAMLVLQNVAYAFETISWDKIEITPKEVPSEPLKDRIHRGDKIYRFVIDKEAVPEDYGYSSEVLKEAFQVPYLSDVLASDDGIVFEKLNKKIPNNHFIYEKGNYFVIESTIITMLRPGSVNYNLSPPKYIYDRNWNLLKTVKAGEETNFDFGVEEEERMEGDPFYEHYILKDLNGWYYCESGVFTRDGFTYHPIKFHQEWLKRTKGTSHGILSTDENRTNGNYIMSYDLVYWYEFPIYYDSASAWQNNEYFYVETEDSYYRMKIEPPNNPYIILNDELLAFEEIPVRENDSLLVPMRFLFEQMGAEVDWDQQTKTATAALANNAVTFSIDETKATVNKVPQQMAVPARLVNGSTMIPLRFLSENLGYTVTWDQEAQAAFVEK